MNRWPMMKPPTHLRGTINRTMAESEEQGNIRLNRYVASCGVGARRKADEYIAAGRVAVNGETVTEPGRRVTQGDKVTFDGVEITISRSLYLIFNKPRGILSASRDSRCRTVIDVLPPSFASFRLFPVGRLDKESEGLMIITNDGMLAQKIIHPSMGVTKTYDVELRHPLNDVLLAEWERGVEAEGLLLRPVSVRRLERHPMRCCFEVVLSEGIKREIRIMARALGNDVRRLVRRRIGRLELQRLQPGSYVSVSKEDLIRYIYEGFTV